MVVQVAPYSAGIGNSIMVSVAISSESSELVALSDSSSVSLDIIAQWYERVEGITSFSSTKRNNLRHLLLWMTSRTTDNHRVRCQDPIERTQVERDKLRTIINIGACREFKNRERLRHLSPTHAHQGFFWSFWCSGYDGSFIFCRTRSIVMPSISAISCIVS